jgi:hypothetical protein
VNKLPINGWNAKSKILKIALFNQIMSLIGLVLSGSEVISLSQVGVLNGISFR